MTSLFDTLSPEGSPIYLANMPNVRGRGRVHHEYVRGEEELQRFIRNYDKPGRALYFTVAKLKDGAPRSKENVQSVSWIWAEIDFKDHPALAPEEIRRRVEAMPYPPTMIIASGHGLHLYWKLNEPADALPGGAQKDIEDALKLACAYVGGDASAAEAARLLRLPGSHNTKGGDSIPVAILIDNKRSYEISDLVDFWLEAQPIMPKPNKANGHDHSDKRNFEFAAGDGPTDVEARLHDMRWQGPGKSGIHITQLQCTGALLRQGVPLLDVTAQVLEATHKAVANDPRCADWDWAQEERAIERMGIDLINKDHSLGPSLPDALWEKFQTAIEASNIPKVSRNAAGLHVREYKATKNDTSQGQETNEETKTGASKEQGDEKSSKSQDSWWPTPYSGRAASQIPLRKFILGKHYLTGASSVTASAGGIGKSTLSLLDAVSFRVGRDLLTGEPLDKSRRVWVWNAEDDIDEMERRIAGICAHYGVSRTDVMDGLFLNSGYDLPLDLAYGNGKGAHVNEPLIDRIAARVKERQIEVVMLDPLVALHSMSEGDNPGHAKLIRTLSTNLAKPCECAVDINTHTRKPGIGQDTLTVDDIRGPGAIVYSARSGRILNPMSLAEAEKYNIEAEERLSYYRLERAKANMAKRGTICWVRMIEVPIANRPDGSYGDIVAVPTLWVPPNAMEGITDTIANAIAGEIAKGDYKRDARAGTSWAGRLVGLRCGIDIGTKSGKERAKVVLETLIKKGVLAVEIRTDKNRNSREYVVPGVLHAPGK